MLWVAYLNPDRWVWILSLSGLGCLGVGASVVDGV